jgi:general secretion pathway protein B
MSYILEALKKSQAERQLGSAPTLQAVPVGAAPAAAAARNRKPLWLALAGSVIAVALALVAWRAQAPAVKPAAPRVAVLAAPAPAVAVAVPAVSAPAAPKAVTPTPAPPLAMVPPSSPPPAPPKPAAPRAPQPAPLKASAPTPAAEEEKLPSLRQLPEAIQRGVPPVTFGGYMYSKNPADRLLLIDKTLRHEGEEVAPGLVLEKLLPQGAVMNYKGNRYRVPY